MKETFKPVQVELITVEAEDIIVTSPIDESSSTHPILPPIPAD